MPFALPLVEIAIKPLIIGALGAVTAVILGWYLSTPSGLVTWGRLVSWVETQIKAPVEWALSGIKEGLKEAAEAWERFRWALSGYVDWVYSYIWQMHDWIMWKYWNVVIPWLQFLQTYLDDVRRYVYDTLAASIAALTSWRYAVAYWLHYYLEAKVIALENWRYAVANWLHSYIERLLLQTVAGLETLRQSTAEAFDDVWKAISSLREGAISLGLSLVKGITSDVLPNIAELIRSLGISLSRAIGIPAILSTLGAWISSLFDSIAKELQPDIDFLDNLELDWLLIAYLQYTKPLVIDRADEVLNTILDCAKAVVKGSETAGV